MTLLRTITQTIRRHDLFQPGQHILVGVSGGADSMALLALLHEMAPRWQLRLSVAHLQHRIRGSAAAQDARFVKASARQLGLNYVEGNVDVPRLARRRGVSLEMAGREARYAFFAQAARRWHCAALATAHNADDQVETVLLKLARGAGPQGLAGIPYHTHWGKLKIIRPLRDASRIAILEFLRRRHLAWREDATNNDEAFLRNRIRHEVLPFLETRLNPRIRQALARTADILEKENEYLAALASNILAQCAGPARPLDGALLASYPIALRRRVLRQWLVAYGMAVNHIDYNAVDRLDNLLIHRQSGRSITLPGAWLARKTGRHIDLTHGQLLAAEAFRVALNIPGQTLLPQCGLRVVVELGAYVDCAKPSGLGQYPAQVCLALSSWRRRRVYARSWQAGDRMAPLGLRGSRKLQDIFTDGKLPREQRARLPLFECAGGLIWLPGYRVARGWAAAPSQQKTLRLTVERL